MHCIIYCFYASSNFWVEFQFVCYYTSNIFQFIYLFDFCSQYMAAILNFSLLLTSMHFIILLSIISPFFFFFCFLFKRSLTFLSESCINILSFYLLRQCPSIFNSFIRSDIFRMNSMYRLNKSDTTARIFLSPLSDFVYSMDLLSITIWAIYSPKRLNNGTGIFFLRLRLHRFKPPIHT